MQTNNFRAMVTEALTAQSAFVEAFVAVASFYAAQVDEEYRAALAQLAAEVRASATNPGATQTARGHPKTTALAPSPASVCRAFVGLPRVSMMFFLSRYDELRGPRRAARD
jgi:hypothetical protein